MGNKDYKSVKNPHRLLTPGCVTLISVGNSDESNLFPVAWTMAVRKAPPMVAILSGKSHYSYKFIQETGEFGLNIPDITLAEAVLKSGKISGAEVDDKFSYAGLTPQTAQAIKAPLVSEAVARMECRIAQIDNLGASALIIAQILQAEVREDCFDNGKWNFANGLELIHHMGGNEFSVCDHSIEIKELH